MTIEELAAERIKFGEQVARTLDQLLCDFKQRTGVAVSELYIETIPRNFGDGRVECFVSKVDLQLDLQVKPANGVGATTQIVFS